MINDPRPWGGTEQGYALQAQQIRQRVLIDHQPRVGADVSGLQLFSADVLADH